MDGHPTGSNKPRKLLSQVLSIKRNLSSNGSGSQGGTLSGTTPTTAQEEKDVPPGERKNKTQVYVSGVFNTRSFLKWLQGKTGGNGTAHMRHFCSVGAEERTFQKTGLSLLTSL